MKRIWDKYFYWNKTERRGVVPLLLLVFVLIAANLFFRYRSTATSPAPDADFLARAQEFNASKKQTLEEAAEKDEWQTYTEKKTDSKFRTPSGPFDPNALSKEEWVNLGLSDKQSESIVRYKSKGGMFYKKEDLKKMYVISDAFFAHIESYLIFPQNEKQVMIDKPKSSPTAARVDINQADSVELVSLTGISPKLAQKILNIRSTFGGLHSLEQIKDLNGFYEPNFTKLSSVAYVSGVTIRPLNLNYCTFKELLQVPGMEYEPVKNILNYRQRNGLFKKTEDLVTLNLAEPDLYAKIAPYLTVK